MSTLTYTPPLKRTNASGGRFRWLFDPAPTQSVTEPGIAQTVTLDPKNTEGLVTFFPSVNAPWFAPAFKELMDNAALKPNWDSYGGKPTSLRSVGIAGAFLAAYLPADAPGPAITPLSDGGVQLEWHQEHADVEVSFPFNKPPTIYSLDYRTGAETEEPLTDYERAREILRLLVD